MDRLSGLLHRRPSEGGSFSAAFVVSTVSGILKEVLQLEEHDARATTFRAGSVLIVVSHGAVAGRIQQNKSRIIERCNEALRQLGAPKSFQIEDLRTRTT